MSWQAIGQIANTGIQQAYNMFTTERNRGDQLKQQGIANKLAQDQFDWTREYNQQSMDYQKELNDLLMAREDTAIQRREKDLQAAGLHPTLAAGGAANTTLAQAGRPAGASSSAPAHSRAPGAGSPQGNIVQDAATMATIAQTKANTALTEAEADRVRADTARITGQEGRDVALHTGELQLQATRKLLDEAGVSKTAIDALIANLEYNYMDKYGLKMPQKSNWLTELNPLFEHFKNQGLTMERISDTLEKVGAATSAQLRAIADGYSDVKRLLDPRTIVDKLQNMQEQKKSERRETQIQIDRITPKRTSTYKTKRRLGYY